MGYEQPLQKIGMFAADVDMSVVATWQYTAVNVGPAQNIVGTGFGGAALLPGGGGVGSFIGVLQGNPVQGEAGEVTASGITKAQAGGAFNVGDALSVDSTNRFVKGASGAATVAVALEQANVGDITTVYLAP